MPEMNGVELATRMSQMCPDCKVLLLSGQPLNREVFEKARNKGYSFSLARKPLQPTVLLDSLDRLFSTNNPALRLARDLGLAAVNRMPRLKRRFMLAAMGR